MKISRINENLLAIKKSENFRSVSDLRMISATRGIDGQGKEYVVFSSNNYLGLTHEKSVIEAAKAAAVFGTGMPDPIDVQQLSGPVRQKD